MTRHVSLSKTDTGFVFATTNGLTYSDRLAWIFKVVRQELEAYEDDEIDLTEGDDMREFVTLNGEPVVEVHKARLSGFVAAPIVLKIHEAA